MWNRPGASWRSSRAGDQVDLLEQNLALLATLARLDADQMRDRRDACPRRTSAASLAAGGVTVYLPLAGMVDLDAERKRIEKELANVDKQLARIDGLLGNPGFTDKAPANVIEREQNKKVELDGLRVQLAERLADLGV